MRQRAIGIFDSGVGGLTVLRQMVRQLPAESFVYYADTARVPYGDKSPAQIIHYSLENMHFLLQQEIKMVVVACSTSCTLAWDHLREKNPFPTLGMIEPGVERVIEITLNGNIAVLATRATIGSGIYQREIVRRLPKAKVFPVACPLFVPLIEESFCSHSAAKLIVKEYLAPLHSLNIDTILLGCTHYPLLRDLIEEEFNGRVNIVDPAICCAEKVGLLLKEQDLYAHKTKEPSHRFYVSGDPQKFSQLGSEIIGMPLEHVELMSNYMSVSCR